MQKEEEGFNTKRERKTKSFIHTLPQAIEIFEVLQHVKKSIYPFDMITNTHKIMNQQQQPYGKQRTDKISDNQKFKPFLETVPAHFEQKYLVYDKFNNNSDQELFNQNIYSIEKLKNLKNIDYLTNVQFTKFYAKQDTELLYFNSRFQSGNLSMASYVEGIYFLLLHNDVNTSGYTSWFYFNVKNHKKGKYKFAILNYGKAGSMHNFGVKICVYDNKNGWKRGCQNISCETNYNIFKKGSYLNFNTLYFQYQFQEDQSEIYFSYNIPYTYNDLCCFLGKIEEQNLPFFNRKLAGISLAGNRLQMICITNFALLNQGFELPIIVIMARSHPGQTVSSWIMHEFIKFLISDDPTAKTLRNSFVFKLFPMINPDGVIHGNYRCSLSGRDLNRRWNQANKQLFPQIYFIRNQIIQMSKGRPIKMIIDLHGHTKKKKIFAYGCNNINQPHRCRLFPYIMSKQTSFFEFKFCNYFMSKFKYGTARISLYNQLKVPYIYTIQTSQFGTFEGHLSLKIFKQIAISLAKTILILFRIKVNEKDGSKNNQKMQNFETQLLNDTNLMKMGNQRDSGSQSEPSVDNIKLEKLNQLVKRRDMKIISRLSRCNQRLKSNNDASQSLQKTLKQSFKRPKTTDGKRVFQQKTKPLASIPVLQKKATSINRLKIDKSKRQPKLEQTLNKSLPVTKRNTTGLNYINLSLSIFDDSKSQKGNRLGKNLQDKYQQFNEAFFSKLKWAPRNYFQLRRIK